MPMKLTPEAAMSVVSIANGCREHPCEVPFQTADIGTVFYCDSGCNCGTESAGTTCNTWCDTWGRAIFDLKDGRYVYANESSDTSGHG